MAMMSKGRAAGLAAMIAATVTVGLVMWDRSRGDRGHAKDTVNTDHEKKTKNVRKLKQIRTDKEKKTSNVHIETIPKKGKSDAVSAMNKRLDALVHRATVMLFMKGTPTKPMCKFSREMIQILRDVDAKRTRIKHGAAASHSHNTSIFTFSFDYFNVLTDTTNTRSALKHKHNFPTYPQLYVKGEHVGGVDIVRELYEQGSLPNLLFEEE